MRHIQYAEVQRFTNVRWIWIMVAIVMLCLALIFTLDEGIKGNYQQMGITFFASLFPIGILFFSRLELRVDSGGLHYKFFPSVFKWRHVKPEAIESFEVRSRKSFCEKFACGYQRSLRRNTIFMNITGSKFLLVKLVTGRKLKIGSENAEEMAHALKRLQTPDTD